MEDSNSIKLIKKEYNRLSELRKPLTKGKYQTLIQYQMNFLMELMDEVNSELSPVRKLTDQQLEVAEVTVRIMEGVIQTMKTNAERKLLREEIIKQLNNSKL